MLKQVGKLVALTVAASVTAASVDLNDACYFVGMRFAHKPSACGSGVCEGIFLTRQGRLTRVSEHGRLIACIEAREMTLDHLREMGSRFLAGPSATDAAKASEEIQSVLSQVVQVVAPDLEKLTKALRVASERIWAQASIDWREWKRSGTLVRSMLEGIVVAMADGSTKLFWSPDRRKAFAALAYFACDLMALGVPALYASAYMKSIDIVLTGTAPLFRDFERREVREKSLMINWGSWAAARLAAPDVEESETALTVVQQFVLSFDGVPSSLEDLVMKKIMTAQLCRDVEALRNPHSFAKGARGLRAVRLVLHWLDLCKERSTADTVASVRAALAEAPVWDEDLDMQALLTRPLEPTQAHIGRKAEARVYLDSLLGRWNLLAPVGDFQRIRLVRESEDAEFMLLLASVVGEILSLGGSVGHLKLAPGLIRMLHPRVRAKMGPEALRRAALDLELLESDGGELAEVTGLMSARIGLALGRGGFASITNEAWMQMFVSTD